MTADITFYEQKFRERGLALTVQRRVILAELLARRDHPTADQVFAAVVGRVPGLSRTTVYRVLETLVGLGMARKVLHADAGICLDCREANSMENNQKGEHHAGTQRIQNTQQPQRRLRG